MSDRSKMMSIRDDPDRFSTQLGGSFCDTSSGWDSAVDEFIATREHMRSQGISVSNDDQDSCWQVPFLWWARKHSVMTTNLTDIGCGLSTPSWAFHLSGSPHQLMIDFTDVGFASPPTGRSISMNILDLGSIRRSQIWTHMGGMMVCTEVLEHLQFNPVPPFLLMTEMVDPDFIYISTSPFLNRDTMVDWHHYSTMPLYRGQRMFTSGWHYKGWSLDELCDFVVDIGFHVDSYFAGLRRLGIVGRRIR